MHSRDCERLGRIALEAVLDLLRGSGRMTESLDRDEYGALVEAGTKIEILPLVPGRSTTNIIKKMASDCGAK